MWVVSTEGFVSRFSNVDGVGSFQSRRDVSGTPVGARFGRLDVGGDDPIDVLFLANAELALAKADLEIAERYVALVDDEALRRGVIYGSAMGSFAVERFSIERFQSLSDPGKLLSLSFWRDEEAVAAWRVPPALPPSGCAWE